MDRIQVWYSKRSVFTYLLFTSLITYLIIPSVASTIQQLMMLIIKQLTGKERSIPNLRYYTTALCKFITRHSDSFIPFFVYSVSSYSNLYFLPFIPTLFFSSYHSPRPNS